VTTTIANLRETLADYLGRKEQVLVLFDNLDKGWSYMGIGIGDTFALRCRQTKPLPTSIRRGRFSRSVVRWRTFALETHST
jgi:hypothetical protein